MTFLPPGLFRRILFHFERTKTKYMEGKKIPEKKTYKSSCIFITSLQKTASCRAQFCSMLKFLLLLGLTLVKMAVQEGHVPYEFYDQNEYHNYWHTPAEPFHSANQVADTRGQTLRSSMYDMLARPGVTPALLLSTAGVSSLNL